MLWKYKKCYQETTEEVVVVPEICTYALQLTALYTGEGTSSSIDIEYILCGDELNTPSLAVVALEFGVGEIRQCIKQGSLFVDGVNITTGELTVTPNWDVTVTFEPCSS